MNLRAALELIRLPAVFTAPSDVLAGVAVAGALGASLAWPSVIILCLASAAVYCAGMAANDLFDLKIDSRERPQRPLPSGRATVAQVWVLVGVLQAAGLGLAALVGTVSLAAAAGTVALTYLYNAVLKDGPFGTVAMGACRYANFLVGASILGVWNVPTLVLAIPLGTLLYVTGLTWISRHEVGSSAPPRTALVMLVGFSLTPAALSLADLLPSIWGALLALLTPLWLMRPVLGVLKAPTPGTTRGLVMAGIFGIAMVNGALAMGAGAPVLAAICIGLLVPGKMVGRWFYAT